MSFDKVKEQVYHDLGNLDKRLYYHGRHHTFDDVVPTAEMLCKEEKLTEEETLLVKTAALFHDTGFLDQYDKNEPFGCERARKLLPSYGYNDKQIDHICEMIMATQMPQNPKDKLAQIVCDADLGHLGQDRCFFRAEGLRLELDLIKGIKSTIREWNERNLVFYEKHHYWTDSAKRLLQKRKEKTIQEVKDFLAGK